MTQEEIDRAAGPVRDRRADASCGSRAATRSSSGAAARRRWCCARPASRTRSCRAITAGIAAPAYAGVPVTHRELASRRRVRDRPREPGQARDGAGLARAGARSPARSSSTWASKALPRIASQLIAGGAPGRRPVAVVEQGTLPGQKTVLSTLGEIGSRRRASARRRSRSWAPSRRCASELAWLESGRCTAARSPSRARARRPSALAARLRDLGADVVEAPAIRTEPLDGQLPTCAAYDLLCVTSPTGADQLFRHLRDARALAGVTVAAIGPGTARRCARTGSRPTSCPSARWPRAWSRRSRTSECGRVLVARARRGPRRPDRRAARARLARRRRRALRDRAGAARRRHARRRGRRPTTSSSPPAPRVRFFAAAGGSLDGPRLVSIGPATSAELRGLGWEPDLEADPHTPDGLIAALLADAVTSAA